MGCSLPKTLAFVNVFRSGKKRQEGNMGHVMLLAVMAGAMLVWVSGVALAAFGYRGEGGEILTPVD